MGYSHYFGSTETSSEQDRSGYLECLPIIRDIVSRHQAILAYECDKVQKDPEVSEDRIRFNGRGDDGHETFLFQPGCEGDFCKTARKPYDLPVCECLLVLKAHLPRLVLGSDGFAGDLAEQLTRVQLDGSWEEAMRNVRQYGIDFHAEIINWRSPYCDLGVVLDHCEITRL